MKPCTSPLFQTLIGKIVDLEVMETLKKSAEKWLAVVRQLFHCQVQYNAALPQWVI